MARSIPQSAIAARHSRVSTEELACIRSDPEPFVPRIAWILIADVGSVAGRWLSSTLITHGRSVNMARKVTMMTCALAVVPIILAPRVNGLWSAVALVAAAHQGWSANLVTIAGDTLPRDAVGAVTGIGGTAGAIGGMPIAEATGAILQATGSCRLVFTTGPSRTSSPSPFCTRSRRGSNR